MILCRTLGPIEVTVDGAPAPAEMLWRKHLALLIYLARSSRHTRSREHLIGLLWADRTEAAARHSLSEALRVIRRHAGQDALEITVGQVGLVPGAVELDVDRLEQLAAAGDWIAASELVAGEFLEGFGVPDATDFEDWLAAEREQWRGRSVEVLVRCADHLTRVARPQDAAAVAGRALAIEPTSEAALRAALRSRSLAGDRAGALELAERFHARLAELGVQPAAETSAMVERVRRERGVRREVQTDSADDLAAVRPPLGGRVEELARLLDVAARSARTGRAALVLLEGEAGVGKSRLLDEMLALLRLDGTAVGAARAVEGDRSDPWSGVPALARGGLLDAQGVAAATPSALAALAAALPEWAERFRGAGSSDEIPLGRALAEAVRAAAAEQPVVLAVDDAQWLDHDSALALGAMLRDLQAAPLTLVLVTAAYPSRRRAGRAPKPDRAGSRRGRGAAPAAGPRGAPEPRRAHAAGVRPDLTRSGRAPGGDRLRRPAAVRGRAPPRGRARPRPRHASPGTWPEPLRTMDQSLPGDLPDAVVAAIRVGVPPPQPTRATGGLRRR